jgi:prolyl-tRNA synthetase
VREEMNRAGAQELLMPMVQPAELWRESMRWDAFGPELLLAPDRHQRDFCLGPTHEEVITDLARRELKSYRQLPVNWYQIQSKFRDEIRPRFGVMRAREFVMKDAYSFHLDEACLDRTYARMHEAYSAGLQPPRPGVPRGRGRHRQHRRQPVARVPRAGRVGRGRDRLLRRLELCRQRRARPALPPERRGPLRAATWSGATPGVRTIAELTAFLGVTPAQCLKTLIVLGEDGGAVALVIRGDHELNAVKAEKLPGVAAPLRMATPEPCAPPRAASPASSARSASAQGLCRPRRAGAGGLRLRRQRGRHAPGRGQLGRDLPEAEADLRNVQPGDPARTGKARWRSHAASRSGHIFQLGRKYSEAMGAVVLDADGREQPMVMGCYGIGVTRSWPRRSSRISTSAASSGPSPSRPSRSRWCR